MTFDNGSVSQTSGTCPARNDCPGCGGIRLANCFAAEGLPAHVGMVCQSREAARRAPTGNVLLAYCRECGLVFNRVFDPSVVTYQPGYEVALHHSATFREFTEGVADRLIGRYDLHGKDVLEIGCGDGHFLRMLCRRGANRGTGIDPTVAREGIEPAGRGEVRFIRDVFSGRYADVPADFVCSLSVLDHLPEPLAFLCELRRMVAEGRPNLYFEIFNAMKAFSNEETWSVFHEQCNYFGRESFADLFDRSGFNVVEAGDCYEEGQYLYVEAVPGESSRPPGRASGEHEAIPDAVSRFAQAHREKLDYWIRKLDALERAARRVVLWGAGGKGLTFLNTLPTSAQIRYVVDINPDRQGGYVPGSAQEIVSPEFLVEYRPDVVIIMNPLYGREIGQEVHALGLAPDLLLA